MPPPVLRAAALPALLALATPAAAGVTYTQLTNYVSNAVCWNGSPSGVYHRPAVKGNNIVIHLQGGGFCICKDGVSPPGNPCIPCEQYPDAHTWAYTADDELLRYIDTSAIAEWADAHVFWLPYCSGDLWSGDTKQALSGGAEFRGYRIMEALTMYIRDVVGGTPQWAAVMGNSAGGLGTILISYQLREWLREKWPAVPLFANPRAAIMPSDTPPGVPCPGRVDNKLQHMLFLWASKGAADWCPFPYGCGGFDNVKHAEVPMFVQVHTQDNNFYPRVCTQSEDWYPNFADLVIEYGKNLSLSGKGHAVWAWGCRGHSFNFFYDQIGGIAHTDAFRCWWEAVKAGRLAQASLAARADTQENIGCARLPSQPSVQCSDILKATRWPVIGQEPPFTPAPPQPRVSPSAAGRSAAGLLAVCAAAVALL